MDLAISTNPFLFSHIFFSLAIEFNPKTPQIIYICSSTFSFLKRKIIITILRARKAKQARLAIDFFRPYTATPTDRFQSRCQHLYKLLGKKESLTCKNSSIPTGFFFYANMAADSLFCTQIWPPRLHVKTIYKLQIRLTVRMHELSEPKEI